MTNSSQNFERFLIETESANIVPVIETLAADLLTPLAVYLKISHSADYSFLLESVEGGEHCSRRRNLDSGFAHAARCLSKASGKRR